MNKYYKDLPAQSDLQRMLAFDAATGLLFWRERAVEEFHHCHNPQATCALWNRKYGGGIALNAPIKGGYRGGSLRGAKVYAHRIIYKLIHGNFAGEIDHIDGDKENNKPENLRCVSAIGNARNRSRSSNNKSGVTGVCWDPRSSRWLAYITENRRNVRIGYFRHKDEAITHRKAAEKALGFHPNHGREHLREVVRHA